MARKPRRKHSGAERLPGRANGGAAPLPDNQDDEPIHLPVDAPDAKDSGADKLGARITGKDDYVEEHGDGSATVWSRKDKRKAERHTADFDDNLAEVVEESELEACASELLVLIDQDRQDRKKRDEQYEEGLKRSGLDGTAPGGANFEGASRAVHPVIAECCVDYAAMMIKELFPAEGPVRIKIVGDVTADRLKAAEKRRQHMNWQLTQQIKGYRHKLEQLLTQQPMGGSQFMNWYWDKQYSRPAVEFLPIDMIDVPSAAQEFYDAGRLTIRQPLTEQEFQARVESGEYRKIPDIAPAGGQPEPTKSQEATARIEGKEDDPTNRDGTRLVFKVNTSWKFTADDKADGKHAPYLISIDEQTMKVVAVYRNWDENDKKREKLDWVVDHVFIPWRGAFGIGLPHLIGSLSIAATGALRALLDSAHANNSVTALKLKGARVSGQSPAVQIGKVTEIAAEPNVTDIRQLAMAIPFNPPSEMLFQLLGWLTDAAKGVITTAEEKIADASGQGPVGTALALIEQGSRVVTAIHARNHVAQAKSLEILWRMNRWYMSDKDDQSDMEKSLGVTRADYGGPCDIIPVSDPDIFAESQRYAQIQAAFQLMATNPELYNTHEMHLRALKLMRFPDPEGVMIQQGELRDINPVAENVSMMMGQPVGAFPEQDHLAHLQVHMDWLGDPMLVNNGIMIMKCGQPAIEHAMQHIALYYAHLMFQVASRAAEHDIGDLISDKPEERRAYDRMLAAASPIVAQLTMHSLEQVVTHLNAMDQKIKSMLPPPPMDPAQAALLAAQGDTQRKGQRDQSEMQLKDKELDLRHQKDAAMAQMSVEEMQQKHQLEMQALQAEQEKNIAEMQARGEDTRQQGQIDQARLQLEKERQDADIRFKAASAAAKQIHDQQIIAIKAEHAQSLSGKHESDALIKAHKTVADIHSGQSQPVVDAAVQAEDNKTKIIVEGMRDQTAVEVAEIAAGATKDAAAARAAVKPPNAAGT